MNEAQRNELSCVGEAEAEANLAELLFGVYKPDERLQALEDRLSLYYKQTPDSMDNREAIKYWRQFTEWCRTCGYTADEINRAKRSGRFRDI